MPGVLDPRIIALLSAMAAPEEGAEPRRANPFESANLQVFMALNRQRIKEGLEPIPVDISTPEGIQAAMEEFRRQFREKQKNQPQEPPSEAPKSNIDNFFEELEKFVKSGKKSIL